MPIPKIVLFEDSDYVCVQGLPCNEDFIVEAKELGGEWDPELQAWKFDNLEHEATRIEELVDEHFPGSFR